MDFHPQAANAPTGSDTLAQGKRPSAQPWECNRFRIERHPEGGATDVERLSSAIMMVHQLGTGIWKLTGGGSER